MALQPLRGSVHLWTILAEIETDVVAALDRVLSNGERAKASNFKFQNDRYRYIFSHGALRHILGQYYLDTKPDEIEFEENEYGKPVLNGSTDSIQFNMSHSESIVVIGITLTRRIGVDAEYVRLIEEMDSIAKHYFTKNERALITKASPTQRAELFYRCWTRKEAYLKAIGTGLSVSLNSFDTSMGISEHGRRIDGNNSVWWLCDISLPKPYVGALVVEGENASVVTLNWNPRLRYS